MTTAGAPGSANPVSGAQHLLRAGDYEAVVASVGASLRVLRDIHGDLTVPYDSGEIRPAMRGTVLVPWPNRIADGRYAFDGAVHQLAVNEPQTNNAAHGLMAWQNFSTVSADDSSVTLAGVVEAQPGYPWRIRVEVTYQLDADGLRQRVLVLNEADSPAPVGIAGHPYLAAGPIVAGAVEDWFLELPADEVMQITPDRMLPLGTERVEVHAARFDFRDRRRIGATELNHAFGSLRRGADGLARVRVTDARGFGVELACDHSCRWIQAYTTDAAGADERRHAIAIEPMTCPPDAFNSTTDVVALEPGASYAAQWWITRIHGAGPDPMDTPTETS